MTDLTGHGLRVDLAHVDSGIVSLHGVDVKGPAVVAVVLHHHARVVGHHVRVDGQYSLRIGPQPGNLGMNIIYLTAIISSSQVIWVFHQPRLNELILTP